MYVCGPTVYNYIHIGNARPMIVFDTVRRYLEYKGYEVNYVSNFTDVDDKIIKKVYFLTNIDHSNEHFSLDPKEQLAAIKDMRANGYKLLGNWHSHPSSPSRPSTEDISLAYDSKASYMILSLMAENPVVNVFHIEAGTWTKEDLRIYSSEYYF